MTWTGRTRLESKFGGRHGGHVRLGDTMVPPKATFTFDGENGSPDLAIAFEIRDGRPECVDFRVVAKDQGRGIRTSDLAVFNLDAMTVNVFTRFAFPIGGGVIPPRAPDARAAEKDIYEARKRSRGAPAEEELRRVADVYRQHLHSAPTQAVAVALGYTPRTAARRVQQARHAGLLPKTTRGKRKA